MSTAPAAGRTAAQAGSGRPFPIRSMGIVLRAGGAETDGSVAVLEHTLPPGLVAMPLHRHRGETETTYVLEGVLTVQVGDEVVQAGPGACVVKPRGVFHTFWNSGERPARFLEVVSPGGLERYYEELTALIPAAGPVDIDRVLALSAGYGIEFDMGSLLDIVSRYEVRLA